MLRDEAEGFAKSFAIDAPGFMQTWESQATARAALVPRYDAPAIQDMPLESGTHTMQLSAHPLFTPIYGDTAEIRMVELGKLIAMQYWVDTDVSDAVHGASVRPMAVPTLEELCNLCLPLDLRPSAQTNWRQVPNGLTIATLDNTYNVVNMACNPQANVVQIAMGTNPNLLLVREHIGRYILANGYHRAWLLRSRGVEMAPAVIVHVNSKSDLEQPGFVRADRMLGDRPPIVDDFKDASLSCSTRVRSMINIVKITVERLTVPRVI
jgi:hypothetical protein